MLSFPPNWIPKVSLDEDKVERAVMLYQWTSDNQSFRWVEKDDLIIVGKYLVHHQTVPYWEIIPEGGVRGYSLYLHEFVELKWYKEQNVNPFNEKKQRKHYRKAHPWGLLIEHRFLQVVARLMCYDFSLQELVLGNPHGDPPDGKWKGDWWLLLKQLSKWLSRADRRLDPGRVPLVREFYQQIGFQEVTPNVQTN